jgi:hypothetical protein
MSRAHPTITRLSQISLLFLLKEDKQIKSELPTFPDEDWEDKEERMREESDTTKKSLVPHQPRVSGVSFFRELAEEGFVLVQGIQQYRIIQYGEPLVQCMIFVLKPSVDVIHTSENPNHHHGFFSEFSLQFLFLQDLLHDYHWSFNAAYSSRREKDSNERPYNWSLSFYNPSPSKKVAPTKYLAIRERLPYLSDFTR